MHAEYMTCAVDWKLHLPPPSYHKKAGKSPVSGPYGCTVEQLAFPPLFN